MLSTSEGIPGYRADWKVEFGEAWCGGGGDHCLEADKRKRGRERWEVNVSIVRAFKPRWDP